jgi:galactokinase/mevalonate kinase-like predicted kinase
MMYRAKRKDAVDLFFILHTGITLHDMIDLAQKIFTKLYKPEYTYETILDNKWDMTEQVEYLISFPPKDKIIQSYLTLEVKSLLEGKL